METVVPTPYKISTITATGSINSTINLDILQEFIRIEPVENDVPGLHAFQFIEYGQKKSETFYRGYSKKLMVSRRKKEATKRFDNQATVIVKSDNHHGKVQYVNMKVFKNGNVQITGLKSVEQGVPIVDFLIEEIRYIYENVTKDIVDNYDQVSNLNYSIRLINSDFRFGYDVKRDKLYKILKSDYPLIKKSFEPCIYPGVKIQYFWNEEDSNPQGNCTCQVKCTGKGSGCGPGNCKKITISVFQSGCVIITGAQSHVQIMSAYDFICWFVKKHSDEVRKSEVLIDHLARAGR